MFGAQKSNRAFFVYTIAYITFIPTGSQAGAKGPAENEIRVELSRA